MSDMRVFWAGLALSFLASCGTEVAPRQEGVGFGNYDEYLEARERDQQAAAQGIVPGMVVSPESTAAASDIGSPTSEDQQSAPVVDTLAMETAAVLDTLEQNQDFTQPDNPNISDEQNFDAVSSRESIESDAERLKKQQEQFQVIEPTALPKRRGGERPNIVAFALLTTHPVGQKVYSRSPIKSPNTTARNCGRYLFADLAQEAFLAAGGPERDPKRLDPDGDGFACKWDPTPFRQVRN